jgi:hypothetical protein
MQIVLDDILKIDMTDVGEFLTSSPPTYVTAENEPYRLLRYMSDKLDMEYIMDFGVATGNSAIVLAFNRKNFIYAIDTNLMPSINDFKDLPIQMAIAHTMLLSTELQIATKHSALISLDISHNGKDEIQFYKQIKKWGFAGMMICDDIHLNKEMELFWALVTEPKYDLTDVGHVTGTGLIDFSGEVKIV